MSISAMKQALEALEYDNPAGRSATITALRQAIAEAEKQKPSGWVHMTNGRWEDFFLYEDGVGECEDCEYCVPLYTAPVHASDMSQERVDETVKSEHEVEFREYLTRLNWQQGFERGWDDAVEKLSLTQEKLGYTAPPKRKWVGLTDDEIVDLAFSVDSYKGLCQATEAKLKEKNCG